MAHSTYKVWRQHPLKVHKFCRHIKHFIRNPLTTFGMFLVQFIPNWLGFASIICLKTFLNDFLAQAVSVPVGWPSGGRLATRLVATINIIVFSPFYSSVGTFSQRRNAQIKTHVIQKPRGRHLSRPRQPFWGPLAAILEF